MTLREDVYSVTLKLMPRPDYQFHYLVNYGQDNCIVILPES
jgi:hypothetical protein